MPKHKKKSCEGIMVPQELQNNILTWTFPGILLMFVTTDSVSVNTEYQGRHLGYKH